jgi:hypothetical protein
MAVKFSFADLFDNLSILQPARHKIEELDTKYEVIRKSAREGGLIVDHLSQGHVSRNARDVRLALLDGKPVTGHEFNIMHFADRQMSIMTEYEASLHAIKSIEAGSRRGEVKKIFDRMDELRKDDDFVPPQSQSQARTVNGIKADWYKAASIDNDQFNKLKEYFIKYYDNSSELSFANKIMGKPSAGAAVGPSISRAFYASTGVALWRARVVAPLVLAGGISGVIGSNIDYVLNGPDEPGFSIAQMLPVAAWLNFEPNLMEVSQLSLMAFRRNPHLYEQKELDGKPNPFYNYIEALNRGDIATMQAQGLSKDQQEALGRIASAPKQGLVEATEAAKAQAARDTAYREAQEARLARGVLQAVIDSNKNSAAASAGISAAELNRKLEIFANPALAIITPEQKDMLVKMIQEASGGDGYMTPDETQQFEAAVDADIETGLDTSTKQIVMKDLLGPRP